MSSESRIQNLPILRDLPTAVKIRWAKEKIHEWYETYNGAVYVSFSGGKDSTILLHLVRQLYPEVPAVFVDTGLEYPEVRAFVKTIDNVVWIKPKKTFQQVIQEYGYPVVSKETAQKIAEVRATHSEKLLAIRLGDTRQAIPKRWRFLIDAPFKISHKCCHWLKKEPLNRYARDSKRMGITGEMASDSSARLQKYFRHGCNAFASSPPLSRPLSIWGESDVFACVRAGLKISTIYTMGYDRTGCAFCGFGCHMNNPNKFQVMKQTHPKLHEYCMSQLGMREVFNFMEVPCE